MQDLLQYKISWRGESFHFLGENITIEIPPNTLPAHDTLCTASVSTAECHGIPLEHPMSKIYDFSPSGLTTQNKIMFVIPLFDSHHYDYDNMTLMYQEDRHSQFVDAGKLKVHKPTWLFYGNKCYVFLKHFCKIYAARKKSSNKKVKCVDVESLLFYKQTGRILELVTTFGCYNGKSDCSIKNVKQVLKLYIVKM